MYFVGIDISKFKHDCAIIDEIGDVVTPSWSFTNDCEGFSSLKKLLQNLGDEIKIGLEATGHYGHNLKLFLENNSFSFMEFNPLLINRFVRSKSLRKTKTDSIDALMIAQYLMTVVWTGGRQSPGRSPGSRPAAPHRPCPRRTSPPASPGIPGGWSSLLFHNGL